MLNQIPKNFKEQLRDIKFPLFVISQEEWELHLSSTIGALEKRIRLSTQFLRNTQLIRDIQRRYDAVSSVEVENLQEALFFSRKGFDNIRVKTPMFFEEDLDELCKEILSGKLIYLPVLHNAHINQVNEIAKRNSCSIPIYLPLNLGKVKYSHIKNIRQVISIFKEIKKKEFIELKGISLYHFLASEYGSPTPFFFRNFRTARQIKSFRKIIIKLRAFEKKNNIHFDFLSVYADNNLAALSSLKGVNEICLEKSHFFPSINMVTKVLDRKSKILFDPYDQIQSYYKKNLIGSSLYCQRIFQRPGLIILPSISLIDKEGTLQHYNNREKS